MAELGQPERKIGEGKDVTIAASGDQIFAAWIKGTRLILWRSGKQQTVSEDAGSPNLLPCREAARCWLGRRRAASPFSASTEIARTDHLMVSLRGIGTFLLGLALPPGAPRHGMFGGSQSAGSPHHGSHNRRRLRANIGRPKGRTRVDWFDLR